MPSAAPSPALPALGVAVGSGGLAGGRNGKGGDASRRTALHMLSSMRYNSRLTVSSRNRQAAAPHP